MSKKRKNQIPDNLLHYDPLSEWSDVGAKNKLLEIYHLSLEISDNTITWYHQCRISKGRWSRSLRFITVLIFIASTIIPYLNIISDDKQSYKILYLGYILAGIGGGFLLLDKYFGFTNSWIRFVLTGMELERIRNNFVQKFQISYLSYLHVNPDSFKVLLNQILEYQDVFHETVVSETKKWAIEFQQGNQELLGLLKKQSEQFNLQIEELKKKQNENNAENPDLDPVTSKFKNEDHFKTLANYNANDVAKAAKIQNVDSLSKLNGFSYCIDDVTINSLGQQEPVLYVGLTGKVPNDFPLHTNVNLDENITLKINVQPIPDLGSAELHLKNSDTISPFSDKDTGTVCCLAIDQDDISKQYILTCGHVISDDELINLNGQKAIPSVFSHGKDIGYLDKCFMGNSNDFALVTPKDLNDLIGSGFNTFPKHLRNEDKGKLVKIKTNYEQKTGYIRFLNIPQSFPLNREKILDFTNLIAISKTSNQTNYTPVTVPGDSGSAVLLGNILIGMIVGGDKRFTYAVPVFDFFNDNNLYVK